MGVATKQRRPSTFLRGRPVLLNVLGIAQSEDLATANTMVKEVFKEKVKVDFLFPVIADPIYKKLKEQSMFDISLNGKSTTGKKFFTLLNMMHR